MSWSQLTRESRQSRVAQIASRSRTPIPGRPPPRRPRCAARRRRPATSARRARVARPPSPSRPQPPDHRSAWPWSPPSGRIRRPVRSRPGRCAGAASGQHDTDADTPVPSRTRASNTSTTPAGSSYTPWTSSPAVRWKPHPTRPVRRRDGQPQEGLDSVVALPAGALVDGQHEHGHSPAGRRPLPACVNDLGLPTWRRGRPASRACASRRRGCRR